ncbi:hypothetical protein B0T10DRAFT_584590 [Thelonectria olida]|uniref:Uncharacterized protein n=1 Tax=Thelonectria olida TaxID=1576542 RepID=A0A9P9AMC6_9HYPO|nr:hypothetical protein B0T10DRAFT_584590 [Thelonectria olida]
MLASKYAMPARMWRHGIRNLAGLAYAMMALLCETVPALENMCIERFGDLDCYRMAIEEYVIRERGGADTAWKQFIEEVMPQRGVSALAVLDIASGRDANLIVSNGCLSHGQRRKAAKCGD